MRASLSLALVLAGALALAPSAQANTSLSSNWSGYAVHRTGVSFRTVTGVWRQPSATCTPGKDRYSAVWVGIGGFSQPSPALEQIGTEVDCSPSGRVVSSAWYELVPAPSMTIRMTVKPGDLMRATVSVVRSTVVEKLDDLTRGRSFRKSLNALKLDVSSAEWIVEAPSDCVSARRCHTLPLTDFGSATFTGARAQSTTGHWGSITDPNWYTTKIRLPRQNSSGGGASPSSLRNGGTTFDVTYSTTRTRSGPYFAGDGRPVVLVHPGR